MKKIVMTMVALLSMTVAVAQQSDNNQGERRAPKQLTPEQMTERMAKDLNLTDAQKAKVTALNTEYKDVVAGPGMGRGHRGPRPGAKPDGQTGATQQQGKQMKAKAERPQLTDEQKAQMKQQMEKRKEYDQKLKQILTDEQYQNWQKHQKRRGPHGPRGGQRPEKAAKE